jgi:soluble lytic murein transglycosylase-like protein
MIFTKEQEYLPLVQQMSSTYGVDPALILAHIKQESGFDPQAYREELAIHDASYGLMQVLLSTAKTIDSGATVEKLYDPAYNMSIGTRYIAKNLARYPDDIESAIAAYNAGSAYKDANGNFVSKSGNTAVQGYVDKVWKNYNMYWDWLNSGAETIDVASDPDAPYYLIFGVLGAVALYMMAVKYVK